MIGSSAQSLSVNPLNNNFSVNQGKNTDTYSKVDRQAKEHLKQNPHTEERSAYGNQRIKEHKLETKDTSSINGYARLESRLQDKQFSLEVKAEFQSEIRKHFHSEAIFISIDGKDVNLSQLTQSDKNHLQTSTFYLKIDGQKILISDLSDDLKKELEEIISYHFESLQEEPKTEKKEESETHFAKDMPKRKLSQKQHTVAEMKWENEERLVTSRGSGYINQATEDKKEDEKAYEQERNFNKTEKSKDMRASNERARLDKAQANTWISVHQEAQHTLLTTGKTNTHVTPMASHYVKIGG